VVVTAYVLFFVAGLAFGYAAGGRGRWAPLALPLLLALVAALSEGVDGTILLRLLVALVVTAVGVVLGVVLDRSGQRELSAPGGR